MLTVSVIIPTHNRPESVQASVKSVLNQSRPVDELIVVNDGSSDPYPDIEAFVSDYGSGEDDVPRFEYIENPTPQGAASARNTGASVATGDIYMFLDDDDRWRKNKVHRQVEHFERRPNHGIVYSGRVATDESGNELYSIGVGSGGNLSKSILERNEIGTTSTPAIDANLFDSVGGFDPEMPALQDWELWIRLCQDTLVGYDPAETVEWTIHDDGGQMTADHVPYAEAIHRIERKHADLFKRLSRLERRQACAFRERIVASKRPETSPKRYTHLAWSLFYWPTPATAAAFLPDVVVQRLRSYM